MSGNLGYDRLREFEQQVTQIFEHNSLLRFFPMMKVGDGKQTIQKKFPMPISMTKAEKEILTRNIEKFYAAPGEFRLPRVERTIELSNDEFDAMVSEGELSGLAERAAMDFAMNVDRDLIWQNSANITKIPFYGLYDAGTSTGTTARPIVVLTSDPGAAFSSAGVAAAAIANLLQIESYSPFIVKNRNGLNKENSGLVVCIPDKLEPGVPEHHGRSICQGHVPIKVPRDRGSPEGSGWVAHSFRCSGNQHGILDGLVQPREVRVRVRQGL
jgi:hypothetical protein